MPFCFLMTYQFIHENNKEKIMNFDYHTEDHKHFLKHLSNCMLVSWYTIYRLFLHYLWQCPARQHTTHITIITTHAELQHRRLARQGLSQQCFKFCNKWRENSEKAKSDLLKRLSFHSCHGITCILFVHTLQSKLNIFYRFLQVKTIWIILKLMSTIFQVLQ